MHGAWRSSVLWFILSLSQFVKVGGKKGVRDQRGRQIRALCWLLIGTIDIWHRLGQEEESKGVEVHCPGGVSFQLVQCAEIPTALVSDTFFSTDFYKLR